MVVADVDEGGAAGDRHLERALFGGFEDDAGHVVEV
jgi:hypothetical protein